MKPLLALLTFFCVIGAIYAGLSSAEATIVGDMGHTPLAGGVMLTTGVVLLMKGGG